MPPDTLAGRYDLHEPLGSGGMATVYAAHDRLLDREVAVKLLDPTSSVPQLRERFLREARAAASLSHPNAVAVHDVGEDGGQPYLVMELVPGEGLDDVLRRGPIDPAEAVHVMDGVLAALSAAHARGLVHRDVKPSNILLTRDGQPKLADFGIAKALAAGDLTTHGMVLGTPTYLAPEQAAGRPATAASDIYSAGLVLYECLAGVPPFPGDNALSIALAHQRTPPPSLAARRPDLPLELVTTVERALAKDPADRYPDAEAMRVALRSRTAAAVPTVRAAAATAVAPTIPASARPTIRAVARPAGRRRDGRVWPLAVAAIALIGGGAALASREDPAAGPAPSESAQATGQSSPVAGLPVPETPSSDAIPETPSPNLPTPQTPSPDAPIPETPASSVDPLAQILQAESLEAFTAALVDSPDAVGARADDLLRGIEGVIRAKDDRRAREATDLLGQVADWVADGDLDVAVAQRAATLLAPLAPAGGEDEEEEGGDD